MEKSLIDELSSFVRVVTDQIQKDVLRDVVGYLPEFCHEINKVYCEAACDDYTQPSFKDIPVWQYNSLVNGINYIKEHPDSTPEQNHDNWLALKKSEGWTYGPVKDVVNKTHPCMLPYNELPKEQRVKDALFCAIVKLFWKIEIETTVQAIPAKLDDSPSTVGNELPAGWPHYNWKISTPFLKQGK